MQIAVINKMMPKGYKFELCDIIKKNGQVQTRQTPARGRKKKVSLKEQN